METTISHRLLLTEYTNPFGEKWTVLKDSYPLNDNCNQINISENELAALRRVLVKPVLEELLSEIRDTVSEIRELVPAENRQYDAGKISAYVDIGEIIRTKLNQEVSDAS